MNKIFTLTAPVAKLIVISKKQIYRNTIEKSSDYTIYIKVKSKNNKAILSKI